MKQISYQKYKKETKLYRKSVMTSVPKKSVAGITFSTTRAQ